MSDSQSNHNKGIKQLIKHLTMSVVTSVAMAVFLCIPLSAHAFYQDGTIIKGPKGAEASDVRSGEERYGPIKSSDTLWSIASRYRPHSSVTVYQTMAAIVQANPRAFVDGNMNRMLDGFYLRIPSLQEIKMINPEAARRQVLADESLQDKQQQLAAIEQQAKQTRTEQQQLLEQAKARAEEAIQQVESRQQSNFAELQSQVNDSMNAVKKVYAENESIQKRLDDLADRIATISEQLKESDDLEGQFNQLLEQQRALINQQQQQQSADGLSWLQSPLNIALLSILPALLILGLIYWFFFRRNKTVAESSQTGASEQELTEEQAAEQLDRELMGGASTHADDGLFDFDGNTALDDEEEEGNDLSDLEAELENSPVDQDDDFSIQLDGDDDEEDPLFPNNNGDSEGSDVDDIDQHVLPEEDDESLVAEPDTDKTEPEDSDESSELSQDELDKLFGEAEDDEVPALDLDLDEQANEGANESEDADVTGEDLESNESAEQPSAESEDSNDELVSDDIFDEEAAAEASKDEPEQEPEPEAEQEPEPEPEAEETQDQDSEADVQQTPSSDDSAEDTEFDDGEHDNPLDDALAQLGIETDEVDEEEPSDEVSDEQLDDLLNEAAEVESSLTELTEDSDTEADKETEHASTDQAGDADTSSSVDEYVDIDELMEQADSEEETDNYTSDNVGRVLGDEESESSPQDELDTADEERLGQLDLARAYLDMDEKEDAEDILITLSEGEDEVAEEARVLLQRLQSE